MQTVDIPLGSYVYRFRKLTFEEEFALDVKPGESTVLAVLAAALVAVSNLALYRGCGRGAESSPRYPLQFSTVSR